AGRLGAPLAGRLGVATVGLANVGRVHSWYAGVAATPRRSSWDRSGRRRRLLTLVGAAVGVVLVAGLGLFAAGLVGSRPVSLPGWPDPGVQAGQDRPASNTPAPSTATTTPASRRTSRTTPPPAAPTPTPT